MTTRSRRGAYTPEEMDRMLADARDEVRVAQMDPLDDPALLETLAAIEHERWSGWEVYRERCVAEVRRDGDVETHEERWRRLRATPYAALSEREKESDRIEARKTLAAVRAHLATPTPTNGDAEP